MLPEIEGGWEIQSFPLRGAGSLRLHVPRTPEGLLDDADVIERNRFNDSMPYWAWVWDSAPLVVERLADRPSPSGARVLELGAGLGLVGIAAALLADGPVDLTLTDHDPLALEALRANAALNGLDDARIVELDWHRPEGVLDGAFDLVLGCDVAYEAKLHGPLLEVVDGCLAAEGRALFADPGRTRLPGFVRRAEARGFRVDLIDAEGAACEPSPSGFRLATLTRSPATDSGAR
ncbi:MAG: methyltransferase [Planctomycetota bacterium]